MYTYTASSTRSTRRGPLHTTLYLYSLQVSTKRLAQKPSFTLPQSDMVKWQHNHQKKTSILCTTSSIFVKSFEVNQQINNVATDRLLPWAPASEESCHFQRSMRHIGLRWRLPLPKCAESSRDSHRFKVTQYKIQVQCRIWIRTQPWSTTGKKDFHHPSSSFCAKEQLFPGPPQHLVHSALHSSAPGTGRHKGCSCRSVRSPRAREKTPKLPAASKQIGDLKIEIIRGTERNRRQEDMLLISGDVGREM